MNVIATAFYGFIFATVAIVIIIGGMHEHTMWLFGLLLIPLGIWAAVDVWYLWHD